MDTRAVEGVHGKLASSNVGADEGRRLLTRIILTTISRSSRCPRLDLFNDHLAAFRLGL